MALGRVWLFAGLALAGAFMVLSLGASATVPETRDAVEVERWLLSQDGRFRRVTIVVDARVADPDAVADARYPLAFRNPGVAAQFVTFAKWAPGDTLVPVLYDDALDPVGIDGNPHLQWAMDGWSSVGEQSFAFAAAGASSTFTPTCGDNEGDFTNTVRFSFLLDPGVLGETCAIFDFDGIDGLERIVEFDIHMDAGTDWSVAAITPPDRFDFRSVLLHELGHALGLDHSGAGTVMQPLIDTGEMLRTLTDDDVAGLRALYAVPGTPEPTTTATPTPTPTPTSAPGPNDRRYRSTLGAISRD